MRKKGGVLDHLKNTLTKHFGKTIDTATDCEELKEAIKLNLNVDISSQTLRRFFGLIKSESAQSKYTLDLLSKFCGYQNFKDFGQHFSNVELELFFDDVDNTEKNYWKKSEQLCQQIMDSPELLINTHHRLLQFPMARKYFMEHHPSRDLLGTVYTQYFMTYLKYNTCSEGKIFVYGFLFKSAFLQQNLELMELFYTKVKNTELPENCHVILAGLKYGTQLLYADLVGDDLLFKQFFAEMKNVRRKFISASEKSVCSFEYTVLESLIFTDRTAEMKYLIENNTPQKGADLSFIPVQRKNTHDTVWEILCAVSFQKIGDQEKAEQYFAKIDLDNLGVGWQKYYSIIYYLSALKRSMQEENSEIISKLKVLIEDTHFSYFENLLFETNEVSPEFDLEFSN